MSVIQSPAARRKDVTNGSPVLPEGHPDVMAHARWCRDVYARRAFQPLDVDDFRRSMAGLRAWHARVLELAPTEPPASAFEVQRYGRGLQSWYRLSLHGSLREAEYEMTLLRADRPIADLRVCRVA